MKLCSIYNAMAGATPTKPIYFGGGCSVGSSGPPLPQHTPSCAPTLLMATQSSRVVTTFEQVIRCMVDHPNQVRIHATEARMATLLEVEVAPSDYRFVVGRKGVHVDRLLYTSHYIP